MKNQFTCIEGGALKVKGTELFVLPYYKTAKGDPNINAVLSSGIEPSDKAMILSEHKTGEIIKLQLTAKSFVWLICLSENMSHFALKLVLTSVLNELDSAPYKSIVIAQLALIETGYENEEKWKRAQNADMEAYADKHPDVFLTMVVPGDDYRPRSGKHFGEGIIPEEGDGSNPEDVQPNSSHHEISFNDFKPVRSYVGYFEAYIDARERQQFLISTHSGGYIESLDDLRKELKEYEGRDRLENFRKWEHPAPKKKGKGVYCPAPSKQKLKLIILLLDMSLNEAKECLAFFGYGLARFDKADMAFAYILKTNEGVWKKPLDVREVDKSLCKRFGNEASIIAKVNKKG